MVKVLSSSKTEPLGRSSLHGHIIPADMGVERPFGVPNGAKVVHPSPSQFFSQKKSLIMFEYRGDRWHNVFGLGKLGK